MKPIIRVENLSKRYNLGGEQNSYSTLREFLGEIMVSEEECFRTVERGDYYAILPVLPELREEQDFAPALTGEYSSKDKNISVEELKTLLTDANAEISTFLTKP